MDIEEEHPRVAVLDPSKIRMQNRIGRGCQGCVYNAYHAETFQRYAVKVMNTKTMTEKEQERLKCEIESNFTLSSKSHLLYFPFFYGYWTTQTNVYLVFERCEGNALEGMSINRTPACSYSFAYVLLYDVLNALALLESKNIIHRDLKPENILLDRGHFKICDLGLSRIAEKGKKLTMDVGNIMSRSPQFYSGNYDCKTDIWSLGINAFWLAFGTLPFDEELKQMIKGKKIADIITRISKKQFTINFGKMDSYLLDVLKDMLEIQRDDRLGASQNLAKHFGGIQFDRGSNAGQPRFLFFRYLGLRSRDNSLAFLYLILMLLVTDFTKMDDHLKKCAQIKKDGNQTRQKGEQGKKQIVRRVKLNIFYLLKFITEQIQTEEEEIVNLYRFYIDLWREELERDPKNSKKVEKQVKKIEECLEIHKIKSIADKFPLVLEAVRVYRYMNQPEGQRLYLWDLHNLDLRKLKI